MSNFNRMTLVAAAKVISTFKSHSEIELLEVQWGIDGKTQTGSKDSRAASIARIAINESHQVIMQDGQTTLAKALVAIAITAPPSSKTSSNWQELKAGLKLDGYEIVEIQDETKHRHLWDSQSVETKVELRRMLPVDVCELDCREAEDEVSELLGKYQFTISIGHLRQAIAAFSRGDWAASNSQIRTYLESCITEIAVNLGCDKGKTAQEQRHFLGGYEPPFLISNYNEWHSNPSKHQFIQGLMSRLHPEGSHPGLSEENDATFRLQITLITSRLLLRRFDDRNKLT